MNQQPLLLFSSSDAGSGPQNRSNPGYKQGHWQREGPESDCSDFSLHPQGSSVLLQAHMRGEDPLPRAPFLPAEGSMAAGLGHLGRQRQCQADLLQIMSSQEEGRKKPRREEGERRTVEEERRREAKMTKEGRGEREREGLQVATAASLCLALPARTCLTG